jgi:hypothetical protein
MRSKGKCIIRALPVLAVCLALLIYVIWHLVTPAEKSSQPVEKPSTKPDAGRWRNVNNAVNGDFKDVVKNLSSLPYLQGYHEAPIKQGITIYDANLAYDGFNLYCSGHAPEAGIMDMKGNILHKWTYNFEDIPIGGKYDFTDPIFRESITHWRRVYLYENGDILAIHDGVLLIRLDKDSNLLTVSEGAVHHHMQVMKNGNIYTLMRKWKMIPWVNKDKRVVEDFIVFVAPNGEFRGE